MRTITPADIVTALAHCDPRQLARALASCPDPAFSHLADALLEAAELKAAYPRADVITEADALLYDVLRWPIQDANPARITIDPVTFARDRGVSIAEAARILQHVAATDSHACDQLIASGVEPNFTLEQAQVYDCIVTLRTQGRIPTRGLVRDHATRIATSAMRPSDGPAPIAYPTDPGLAPRIISPSPKVHVLLWLDRMDATPPSTGILDERIAYLADAKASMGKDARTSEALVAVARPVRCSAQSITTRPAASLSLAG